MQTQNLSGLLLGFRGTCCFEGQPHGSFCMVGMGGGAVHNLEKKEYKERKLNSSVLCPPRLCSRQQDPKTCTIFVLDLEKQHEDTALFKARLNLNVPVLAHKPITPFYASFFHLYSEISVPFLYCYLVSRSLLSRKIYLNGIWEGAGQGGEEEREGSGLLI